MKQINYHWGRLLKEKKPKLFDGIKELLNELKNKGYFLAIATSRTKEELNELDELIDYLDLFNIVITSDLIKNPKPSPESINIIVNKFSLNREETIYIGDSPSDQKAAFAAIVKFGFASWENKNEISEYDYNFAEPKEIYKLIR